MKRALLLVAAAALMSTARAEPAAQSNWYVLAGGSYAWADGYEPEFFGNRGGEFGFGWMLGSGWVVNDRFSFELAFLSRHLNVDGATDIDQYGVEGSGLFFLNRDAAFSPFLVVGIGGVDNNRVQNQGPELFASLGLGVSTRLGDGPSAATARIDARFVEEFGSRSLNDAVVNLALQIPVGGPR